MYISWKWTYETGADSLLVRLGPMSEGHLANCRH